MNVKTQLSLYLFLSPHMKCTTIYMYLFTLLRRACCRVTQLLHQPLHIYKIYKIYTLKH